MGRGQEAALARVAALAGILAVGATLRLWGLDRNGYGTEYYTAGVRSMLDNLHNFIFNAFDPAGFVSLDKPPVAFWIQVASAKLLGFDGLSVLLPQVLEGVAAIGVLYHLVGRRFGTVAGLLAALFLALTPISVAVDRSSNTESCLILVLLLAAWALVVATERASLRLLVLSMALVGVAFNVKMLAAFVVLPGFALSYLVGAAMPWPRRLAHLTVGGIALAAVSLTWVVAYDLTPPEDRPFAGSTRGNSMTELAFQQYGVERLMGRESAIERLRTAAPSEPSWYAARRVPPGALRLLDPRLAGQVAWLLPLALAAIVAWWWMPRQVALPALALWGGWLGACAGVFSGANGIFHSYYVVLLAPPLAALAAIGLAALWSCRQRSAWLLPAFLALTVAWQAWLQAAYLGLSDEPGSGARLLAFWARLPRDWRAWLFVSLLGVGSMTAVALSGARSAFRSRRALAVVGVALAALLATPTIWALSVVVGRNDVWFPVADPTLLTSDDSAVRRERRTAASPNSRRLAEFIAANHASEHYALATLNAIQAAPLIILTGAPVIALGGYNGTDPIVTPAQVARLVEAGQLRFALLPAQRRGRTRAGGSAQALAEWIHGNGTLVDPALWQAAEDAPTIASDRGVTGMTWGELYDLRPTTGALRSAAD